MTRRASAIAVIRPSSNGIGWSRPILRPVERDDVTAIVEPILRITQCNAIVKI